MSKVRKMWIILLIFISISVIASHGPISSAILCWIIIAEIVRRSIRDKKKVYDIDNDEADGRTSKPKNAKL